MMASKNRRARGEDRSIFRNEDLVLQIRPHDPSNWDETRYELFLDLLCGDREYQKEAILSTLSYLLGGRYNSLRELARANFETNDILRDRWGRAEVFEQHLQLPEKLSCSLDLATATGKSFVLYGIAAILLAEGKVDRVVVLCPSNTIEAGLLEKFKELAGRADLRDAMPADAILPAPSIINASESIVEGSLCVENYHAVLEHVNSSIRDSLKGKGERTAVLSDEAHHVANDTGTTPGKWKEFLTSDEYGFKYLVGVSGTCYVGNNYFSDVVYRYSLRQAIEERFVKKVEYVAEMPATRSREDRWQLVWNRHEDWRKKLASRNIRPLTIVVTQKITAAKQVAEELIDWLQTWEGITREAAQAKVLVVTSNKEHQVNVAKLKDVDRPASPVEWIVSVSMLSEGWDVKNVFQIVPHEERAFNSKLLISQVLGRGLRKPDGWAGSEPIVTVFNHDSWSARIKHLVNEVLEVERRLSAYPIKESPFNFEIHNLDYSRIPEVGEYAKKGEYKLFENGYVVIPSQVVDQAVSVDFERAVTGEHVKFRTTLRQQTYSAEDVSEQIYQRLKAIDDESSDAEDIADRTQYAKRFTRERCSEIVLESLKQARVFDGRVTDENRQKFLQALGTLQRKASKRVVYVLSPQAMITTNTANRASDSVSAAELRRGSKAVFFTADCAATLREDQLEFFNEVDDEFGDFSGARFFIANPADFKTPLNLAIADGGPERRFLGMLTERSNAQAVTAWLKNAAMNFYSVEFAWRKGEHTKRGEFSPDFIIKQGNVYSVVEIKDDGEVSDPSAENLKKHEFARAHFDRLNEWLISLNIDARYQFNMISPSDFGSYFQKLREQDLIGYRSGLDAAMMNASG